MIPRICYSKNITDKTCVPCSIEQLKMLMASEQVQDTCDQIKLLDGQDPEELARLKKQLPIITPHAQRFDDNRRLAANAVASGLTMLDVDHIEDPHVWWENMNKELLPTNHVYMVAITPSGHGLRIIAERELPDLSADMQRLAQTLGIATYDSCTRDMSRASFVMPASYVLYMKEDGLQFDNEAAAEEVAKAFKGEQESIKVYSEPQTDGQTDLQEEETLPTTYHGASYSDIVNQLVGLLGGSPEYGERNTFYFTLVRYIRYICNFNAQLIVQILPDFGLSIQERQSIAYSGVNRPRKSEMPDLINRALAMVNAESQQTVLNKTQTETSDLIMPKLPKVLDIICNHLPESFRPAMVIASLPVLGTLATKVRFQYLDHAEHSFSFMSCITAPAATGKSFIREPINLLLTPIDEQDEVEREKEQEYKDALRAAKNSKNQPDNPRACPRNNGINVSIAKLLQLLTYSEGKHLIGIGEEIDTLVKSERAGVWSQKSDIYRLGFDNAKYGQNYMSDNSFSANVPVYYNLLLTGTPGGMYRFFKDVEDGLVTRFCFAQLPDMFGAEIPDFQPYSKAEREKVIRYARYLYESKGTLRCSAVDAAIRSWLEQKRQMAIAADSRAIDTLRRRSAVIGFRAGYLASLMLQADEKKSTKTKTHPSWEKQSADFATYVAEYVFRNQMALFGAQFEKAADEYLAAQVQRGHVRKLLQLLPETFTRADLMALRARNGQTTDVAYVLTRWRQNGLITDVGVNTYQKVH